MSLKESTGVSKGNLQVYLSDENGNCKTCIVDDECESIYSVEKKSVLKTGYCLSNRDERKKMEQWISGFIPMWNSNRVLCISSTRFMFCVCNVGIVQKHKKSNHEISRKSMKGVAVSALKPRVWHGLLFFV